MYEWKTAACDKTPEALTKLLNDMEADGGWAPAQAPWLPAQRRIEKTPEGDQWIETVLITFVREPPAPEAEVAEPEDAQPPAGASLQDALLYHLDAAKRALGHVPRQETQQHKHARRLLDQSLQSVRAGVQQAIQGGHL